MRDKFSKLVEDKLMNFCKDKGLDFGKFFVEEGLYINVIETLAYQNKQLDKEDIFYQLHLNYRTMSALPKLFKDKKTKDKLIEAVESALDNLDVERFMESTREMKEEARF